MDAVVNPRRYRIVLRKEGKKFDREITLASDEPVKYLLNWVEDEYEFKATIKQIWWLRDDGAEEQIY